MSNLFRTFSARARFFRGRDPPIKNRPPPIDKTRAEKYNRAIKRGGAFPDRSELAENGL